MCSSTARDDRGHPTDRTTQSKITLDRINAVLQAVGDCTGGLGEEFFPDFVERFARCVGVRVVFVSERMLENPGRVRVLTLWNGDRLENSTEYDLVGTPCERVLKGEFCFYRDEVARLFPRDAKLRNLGARGYVGIPLRDGKRRVIGHMVLLDNEPIDDPTWMRSLLHALAARAAAELERGQADRSMRATVGEWQAAKTRFEAENSYLRNELALQGGYNEIVGSSPPIRRMIDLIGQVAPTDTTVLILGETGTGKELVARAIHAGSPRAKRALVSVNCGAISPGLVESELFGHEKGAFTGASTKRVGRFELADGGSLLLDEIGDLSLELQVKLLRVLQEGEFTRVGGNRSTSVNVRIIAATHRDLTAAIRDGTFRQDLYYRLNVFPIRTPPLRDRLEDLPQLVEHLVQAYAERSGKRIHTIPDDLIDTLTRHQWPGNVRELANVVERSVIISPGPTLQLAEWLTGQYQPVSIGSETGPRSLETVERDHILGTLRKTGWKVSGPGGAAEVLGLKPTTLEARMKKLGLKRPRGSAAP